MMIRARSYVVVFGFLIPTFSGDFGLVLPMGLIIDLIGFLITLTGGSIVVGTTFGASFLTVSADGSS